MNNKMLEPNKIYYISEFDKTNWIKNLHIRLWYIFNKRKIKKYCKTLLIFGVKFKINKIAKILKKYGNVFDGWIAPEDFKNVAIDIKKIVDKEINNAKDK